MGDIFFMQRPFSVKNISCITIKMSHKTNFLVGLVKSWVTVSTTMFLGNIPDQMQCRSRLYSNRKTISANNDKLGIYYVYQIIRSIDIEPWKKYKMREFRTDIEAPSVWQALLGRLSQILPIVFRDLEFTSPLEPVRANIGYLLVTMTICTALPYLSSSEERILC